MIIQGDALTRLKELDSESVDCCITSPPYWALRDYKTTGQCWGGLTDCEHDWSLKVHGHPTRGNRTQVSQTMRPNSRPGWNQPTEIDSSFCSKCNAWRGSLGLEPTIQLYIDHLVEIFDQVKRVLKKTGTCWVVIGDTYAAAGTRSNRNGMSKTTLGGGKKKLREIINNPRICSSEQNISEKSLCMIPERFAIKMIDHGWILRNKIIWYKPNCMPSSAKDRFTVDFENIYFFTRSQRYYFETQYEPMDSQPHKAGNKKNDSTMWPHDKWHTLNNLQDPRYKDRLWGSALGRIKRCVWKISTKPYSGAHFAVFPPDLVLPMLKAGCPEFICNKCGFMRKLEYEETRYNTHSYRFGGNKAEGYGNSTYSGNEWEPVIRTPKIDMKKEALERGYTEHSASRLVAGLHARTYAGIPIGSIKHPQNVMTSCNCNEGFHPGICLDPFFGSGTVGLVALQNGRDFIGIELSSEYIKIAEQRLKPLLEQTKLPS